MDRPDRAGRYFAMMRYEHRLMAVAICCIALGGCKKEEEERAPVVTIVAPASGFDLSVPDTLNVVADISGEQDIDQVSFTISNVNGVPIMEPLVLVPAGNPVRLEVGLPLTSDLIDSGDYTLTVQASAGDAHGKDVVGIDIIGAPLRLRSVVAVARPDADQVSIHLIDSSGSVTAANTLLMDLAGAAVSSAAQTFAVIGSVDGPLTAFRPDGILVRWQKPNQGSSGIPWFTSLDLCDDGRFYVGTTDGTMRGYNALTGATERTVELLTGFRASSALIVGERLLVAQADALGGTWRLGVHQASSGAMVSDQDLDQSVVAMFRRNDQHALLFGDRNGHGVVQDHDIGAGGGWEPYSWTARINSVERVDANTFLVALADGTIERFTYSNAGSMVIANVADVRDLSLDPVSGLVFAAAGNEVVIIDPQNGSTSASYPMGAPVRYALPFLSR